jgi:hypothetical protein
MDRERLAQQLTHDYGHRLTVEEHAGHRYVGVQHRCEGEGFSAGAVITSLQSAQLLHQDIEAAWQGVLSLWPEAEAWPELSQQVAAWLTFSVGARVLQTARTFVAAVQQRAWAEAATALEQSAWAHHHWAQAGRLVAWLRAL